MLKISNLVKYFGKSQVINGLTLDVPDVGITAVMGTSGIGKTTLLNIIAGIESATEGEIKSTFKKISYKFQEPRLLDWLTAKENVEAVLDDISKDIALRLLNTVELFDDDADKYPNQLSGGMQQRVALARALAYGGDLLLLDEPFGAVDAETKRVLMKAIKEYSEKNAVIMVTHDINEALELGAKIITLS